MQVNRKDLAAGALFVAIGLYFALGAWFGLRIGHTLSMGPGYFPLWLGIILTGFGAVIAFNALRSEPAGLGRVSWRGVILVTASVVFFGATARGLGLGPALFISIVMASLSTDRTTWRGAVVISAALTVFCVLVFIVALRLPYDIVGPWLWHKG
jgi:hypothetical protein